MTFTPVKYNLFSKNAKKLTINLLIQAHFHIGGIIHPEHIKIIPYIMGVRHNFAIFNLNILLINLRKTLNLISNLYYYRKIILVNFVPSDKKLGIQGIYKTLAGNQDVLYTKHRWVGGTLTNYYRIHKTITNIFFTKTTKKIKFLAECRGLIFPQRKAQIPHFLFSLAENYTAFNEAIKLKIRFAQISDTNYYGYVKNFNLFMSSSLITITFLSHLINEVAYEGKCKEHLFFK